MSFLAVMKRGAAVGALVVLAALPASAQLRSSVYVSGLTSPVAFVQDPSNPSLQYVVELGGTIRVIQSGSLLSTPFATISPIGTGGERGLLGLAFPPNYGSSRRFYVCFTNTTGGIVVSRMLRSAGNPLVSDGSRFDLVWQGVQAFIPHPQTNHNGGNIAFGPDGYLYVGVGDGGGSNDFDHNAQNPATLLGKMLRVDVSVAEGDAEGYDVPVDNPFLGKPGYLPEIWSIGWRNPWRWSFDDPSLGGTGAIVAGDVGQGAREEIDYEPAGLGGRNYGWRNREGTLDTGLLPNLPPAFTPLDRSGLRLRPIVGTSVTGGFVYRGAALGADVSRAIFLRRLRHRPRVVARALDCTGHGRSDGVGPGRPHGGARRDSGHRRASPRSASTHRASCTWPASTDRSDASSQARARRAR